jgi:hypothetical protein
MSGDLAIATAPRRDSLHWKQGTIAWADLVSWTEHPADHKECGGYLLGVLRETSQDHKDRRDCFGLHRTKQAVVSRSALALDADSATVALVDMVDCVLGARAIMHTTFTSTPEALRLRILLALSRPVNPDEYRALSRAVMAKLGLQQFDAGSVQPERYMFRPSAQNPDWYQRWVFDGEPLDVDALLAEVPHVLPRTLQGTNAAPAAARAATVPEDVVQEQVARDLNALDALAALPDGSRLDWPGKPNGVGWDEGVWFVAQRLVQAANSGSNYTLDDARRDYLEHAPAANGTYDPEHKWTKALRDVGDAPLPYTSPQDDFGPVAAESDQRGPSPYDRAVAAEVQKLAIRDEAGRQFALSRLGDFVPAIRDLTDVARDLASGSVRRPEPSVGGLLYPGRVNAVYGTHTAGKTWVGLYLARENAPFGRTLIVDYEDTAEGIADRCVGLDAELVTSVRYVAPEGPLNTEALRRTIEDEGVTLVIIDSVGESLASMGLDSNVERDVTRWFTQVPDALAAMGPAVLLIDHIAKKQDGTPSPVGSFRKSAAITGAQFALENRIGFSRQRAGWSALTCTKDRNGYFATGEVVGRVEFSPGTGGGMAVDLHRGAAEVIAVTDRIEIDIMACLSERWALDGTLDEDDKEIDGRLTITQIRGSVKGDNTAKREALDRLVDRGFVEKHVLVTGPKRTTELYSPATPFAVVE